MDANPTRWVSGRAEWICVNPGIRAHLVLIGDVLKHLEKQGVFDPYETGEDVLVAALTDFISPVIKFIKEASVSQLEPKFSRKFGEGGVKEY